MVTKLTKLMISSVNKGQKIDSEHFQTPIWSFTAPKFDVKMAQADEPIYINFCSLKSALIVSDSSLSHFSEVFSTKKFVFSLNIHDFITIFLFLILYVYISGARGCANFCSIFPTSKKVKQQHFFLQAIIQ